MSRVPEVPYPWSTLVPALLITAQPVEVDPPETVKLKLIPDAGVTFTVTPVPVWQLPQAP